jgi:hypothetical protein
MKRIVPHDAFKINLKQILRTNCAVLLDRMTFRNDINDVSLVVTFENDIMAPPHYERYIVFMQRM